MVPRSSIDDNEAAISASVPYYPGRDELWIGTGLVSGEVDDREMVHPMADGAEAYYVYESGDTANIRSGALRVRIRELRVRPRRVSWNVVVGSLWFDEDRGTLVRAAFRFAAPFDFWMNLRDIDSSAARRLSANLPRVVRPLLPSIRGQMQAVTIEYALYDGRFWLPRARYAEGNVQVSLAPAVQAGREFFVTMPSTAPIHWRVCHQSSCRQRSRSRCATRRAAIRSSRRGGLDATR